MTAPIHVPQLLPASTLIALDQLKCPRRANHQLVVVADVSVDPCCEVLRRFRVAFPLVVLIQSGAGVHGLESLKNRLPHDFGRVRTVLGLCRQL